MNTPSNDDEEEIFFRAAALPPRERAAFISSHCENTPLARARIERLLAVHEDDAFMATSAAEALAAFSEHDASDERPGERIGNYRLIELLGSGGFGTVWRAEQERPVRREVALKIIKLRMDTREVIARFEQERQALAMMDHAHVARVFDAGVTQSGRPFMVMELVRGMCITDWCDAHHLPVTARLELFIRVCEAVQHAHQKGLIHRDLKPSNILVAESDGRPVPKIIDFGVAKATQGRLTDATLVTQGGQMIGTPLYMSPEQAALNGIDVDARSDIWSLGVLLYELLTGQPPFESGELGHDGLRRAIRERDPRKPSSALTTLKLDRRTAVAVARRCDPAKLQRTLRGDLNRIVMKALEKDREQRYQTANGFAMDVRRFLDREPIVARPPGAFYRLRRLVQRNTIVFGLGTAIFVAVLSGLIASLAQAKRAGRALADLQKTAPVFAAQARTLAANDRFDEAIERIEFAAKLRPDVADYFVTKGDLRQAQLWLREAVEAYREALRIEPANARAQANLALSKRVLIAQGGAPQPPREALAELFAAMQREQRSASELLPVARMLGEESKLALAIWRERLASLPIPPDPPLSERLQMRADGLLNLDLRGSRIADLAPLEGMPLGALNLTDCDAVTDLRPLRGLPLKVLEMRGTNAADLSPIAEMKSLEILRIAAVVRVLEPLRGLSLRHLELREIGRVSLEPIRGMKIAALYLNDSLVTDLSPLAGMPLEALDVSRMPARDFSPLAGAPLDWLFMDGARVGDLEFLRGMPLRQLQLGGCSDARNFAVLQTLPKLELLLLPKSYRTLPENELAAIDALRSRSGLRQLAAGTGRGERWQRIPAPKYFWAERDQEKQIGEALRAGGHPFTLERRRDGTLFLQVNSPTFTDFEFLRGMPIGELDISRTAVADLSPAVSLPLKKLTAGHTRLSDLAPLRRLPLESIDLAGTVVTNIEPLLQCPSLRMVELPRSALGVGALRGLPNLTQIGYEAAVPAAEFWRKFDADKR